MALMEIAANTARLPFDCERRTAWLNNAKETALLPFSEPRRINWVLGRIDRGLENGLLNPEQAERLKQQAVHENMRPYLFDMAVAFPAIEAMGLAAGAKVAWEATGGNLLATAIALALTPYPGSGPLRTFYLGARMVRSDLPQMVRERSLGPIKPKVLPIICANVRIMGAFALPTRIATYSPEMSAFLISDASYRVNNRLRPLGLPGRIAASGLANFSHWLIEKSTPTSTGNVKEVRKPLIQEGDGELFFSAIARVVKSADEYIRCETPY